MADNVKGLGLTAPIVDGKLDYKATSITEDKTARRGSTDLGKDAFLQLLVTQMQNQDPMNPSTDTEYVAQLAQFSQLEQLQNLEPNRRNHRHFHWLAGIVYSSRRTPTETHLILKVMLIR